MAKSIRIESSPRFAGNRAYENGPTNIPLFWSDKREDHENATTIIIGNNGTGKSRLLQSLVSSLLALYETDEKKMLSSKSRKAVGDFSFHCDGERYQAHHDRRGGMRAYSRGTKPGTQPNPLPSRVIAVSASPFDKFPLPLRQANLSPLDSLEGEYFYFGLKDRSGRASASAAIYRTVDNLISASIAQGERQLAISRVFRFLGYQPRIDVRYRLTTSISKLQYFVSDLDISSRQENIPDYQLRRISRFIEQEKLEEKEIQESFEIVLNSLVDDKHISIATDFPGTPIEYELFRSVQTLRRIGVLRLEEAVVRKLNQDQVFNLMEGSSGELAILYSLLGVSTAIESGSVILIDEPEISLHPSWQDRYLDLLLDAFKEFSGCHFILATHSPLILSDIQRNSAFILSLDDEKAVEVDDVSGKSSDYLLAQTFGVLSNDNHYLRQRAVVALRLLAEGDVNDPGLWEIKNEFEKLVPHLDKQTAVSELLVSIISAIDEGSYLK